MKAIKYLSILLIFLSCTNEDCCDQIQELRTQIESTKSIRSFNDYIPEAPKFKEAKWRVFDIKTPSSGCYISEKTDTVYILNYPDWEADFTYIHFQDEEGIRFYAEIQNGKASNYHNGYLPYILIPGQKVEVLIELCGSGEFRNILQITNLRRDLSNSDI